MNDLLEHREGVTLAGTYTLGEWLGVTHFATVGRKPLPAR